ncbi:ABC transporter ATP-binding protein [Patescibacteria group bacterium]|nr:ABC transporter ATP-binding protein [Patescibacteria group bacterium]
MEPIISIKNLSVIYDKGTLAEATALSDVTLDIFPEEFVIVFGPSGCGKSTLLYVISGAERRLASGEMRIKDKDLVGINKKDLINFHRHSVGMVFQAYNLIPTVNVFDNIILPLVFRGVSKKERNEKGKELIERFKIGHLAKMRPNLLSGGQQQRVGIARALVNDTDIILADEPTGNLDSQSAFVAMDMFTELNVANKKTIVLVTHESQYLPYASRIIYMKDGKIIGDVKQERKRPDYIASLNEDGKGENTDAVVAAINIDRLADFFELNLTAEEKNRFNDAVKNFAAKNMNREELRKVMDLSYKDGGMGFYRQTALRILQEIEKVMEISELLNDGKNKEISKKSKIVFNWLFSDYKGKFSEIQEKRAEEAIIKRIKDVCSLIQFQNELDKPLSEKGAGLNSATARNATKKLGIIL